MVLIMKNASKRYRTFEFILYQDNLIHITLIEWATYRRNYSIIKDLIEEHKLLFTSRE